MHEKVTIYTIADEVGMSIAAVSRAFDPHSHLKKEKRVQILETAKRLGYVHNKMAARLSAETIRFGVFIYNDFAPYYDKFIEGIQDAYNEYSGYKVTCDLHVLNSGKDTVQDAIKLLDEMMTCAYHGVIFAGLCAPELKKKINSFSESGIRCILLDSDIKGVKRDGVSMDDPVTAGKMAAQLLNIHMHGNEKTAAVFASYEDNVSQNILLDSFSQSAESYGIKISHVYYSHDSEKAAAQNINALFSDTVGTLPVNGIYVSSANAISICQYLEQHDLSSQISLVTSDIFDELRVYLEKEIVCATIYQNPFSQARAAFEALFHYFVDNTAIPEFQYAKPQIILKSNLNLYE